jgi:hypothetical protein
MKTVRLSAMAAMAILTSACASVGWPERQFAQEQRACAELSLTPGTAEFNQCVGNLDASMFEAGPGYPR